MNTSFYLDEFKKAADRLDKKLLDRKQMEVAVGVVLDSVFLKLYKRSWASPLQDPLSAESRIFFSIWINDAAIEEQKILYNIHAFKLRHLKAYSIQSRKFADTFREGFNEFVYKWPNVSVKFGPLTLMEGWLQLNPIDFGDDILELANNFLEIEHLVDTTLLKFKK